MNKIKLGESEKRKQYKCLVEAPFPVHDWLEKIRQALPLTVTLAQRTPERVSHRRADLVRHRKVTLTSLANGEKENGFTLTLDAEAGTYIKEYVHGDKERTSPSLYETFKDISEPEATGGSIEKFEITHLDVTAVVLPWPTPEDIVDAST